MSQEHVRNNPFINYNFEEAISALKQEAPEPVKLSPHEPFIVDTTSPIGAYEGCDIVAAVKMGRDNLLVLDIRDSLAYGDRKYPFETNMAFSKNTDFLVVNKEFTPNSMTRLIRGYGEIQAGDATNFGRSHDFLKFDFDSRTSRNHIQIDYDHSGTLSITDLGAKNGTKVSAYTKRASFTRAEETQEHKQADALKMQEEAVRRIREQEEAELRAQQMRQRRANAARAAGRAAARNQFNSDKQAEQQSWRSQLAERAQQIQQLDPAIRAVFEKTDFRGHKVIKVPHELPISDAANLFESIIADRNQALTDKKIYTKLAKEFHPDIPGDKAQKAHYELLFKLLGETYDVVEKSFKF